MAIARGSRGVVMVEHAVVGTWLGVDTDKNLVFIFQVLLLLLKIPGGTTKSVYYSVRLGKELVSIKNWYGKLVPVEEVSPLASAPLALARYFLFFLSFFFQLFTFLPEGEVLGL